LKYYPEYISELHQYLKYVFKKNICVCSNFDSKLKITTHVDKFKIEKENIENAQNDEIRNRIVYMIYKLLVRKEKNH